MDDWHFWAGLGFLAAIFAIWYWAKRRLRVGDGGAWDSDQYVASTLLGKRAREIYNEDTAQYDFHDPKNPDVSHRAE